jgi:hypothetical protein
MPVGFEPGGPSGRVWGRGGRGGGRCPVGCQSPPLCNIQVLSDSDAGDNESHPGDKKHRTTLCCDQKMPATAGDLNARDRGRSFPKTPATAGDLNTAHSPALHNATVLQPKPPATASDHSRCSLRRSRSHNLRRSAVQSWHMTRFCRWLVFSDGRPHSGQAMHGKRHGDVICFDCGCMRPHKDFRTSFGSVANQVPTASAADCVSSRSADSR